jgi:hypothetical protein
MLLLHHFVGAVLSICVVCSLSFSISIFILFSYLHVILFLFVLSIVCTRFLRIHMVKAGMEESGDADTTDFQQAFSLATQVLNTVTVPMVRETHLIIILCVT